MESTGTQYMDTGYIPKVNTKMELSLSFNGEFKPFNGYDDDYIIFNAPSSSSGERYQINFGANATQSTVLLFWISNSVTVTDPDYLRLMIQFLEIKIKLF